MKYKGFIIEPSYYAGSDFKIDKYDRVIPRKQTSKDIEYWNIFDPLDNDRKLWAENTKEEAKKSIDDFLAKHGWKRNQ